MPLLGSLRKPLPNNYPVSFSAKTSKDLPSDFEEMPLTAEKNTGNYSDSSEEEFDINFTSNSDENKTLDLEYASDECASEHTTQKRLKKGNKNCVLKVDVTLLEKLFSVFPKKLNGRRESVLYEKTYGSILNAFMRNKKSKNARIKMLVKKLKMAL